jgi:alpha-ribazole phosphatase
VTRFIWVRHGPTHAKVMVGWTDMAADLSDSVALARLKGVLPQDGIVISSDLIRARATADAIQGGRRRLADDPALREMHFGAWEMRGFSEIEAEAPDHIRAFWETPGDIRPHGGESWDDLCGRVGAAVDRLTADHAGKTLIVVAHFGAILAALQRAAGSTAETALSHRIENLSLTEIALGSGGWQVGRINHIA